ncbi:hypothetical protein POVCU2_0048910 [Plasmodium ovale curtisi]|uniref:Uncharacterized protein n=1 Tax=Plasmodium ovale curtisi TaxID=864141 RepID=A0A1A8WZB9_PLAOA|nr:hypothetical protein POVCU2_0048910 [Plasmodium ovale curtisi]SBS98329.1 hypothetical protein POVCU1_045300 [Plasmodium ovale curtisi]
MLTKKTHNGKKEAWKIFSCYKAPWGDLHPVKGAREKIHNGGEIGAKLAKMRGKMGEIGKNGDDGQTCRKLEMAKLLQRSLIAPELWSNAKAYTF